VPVEVGGEDVVVELVVVVVDFVVDETDVVVELDVVVVVDFTVDVDDVVVVVLVTVVEGGGAAPKTSP